MHSTEPQWKCFYRTKHMVIQKQQPVKGTHITDIPVPYYLYAPWYFNNTNHLRSQDAFTPEQESLHCFIRSDFWKLFITLLNYTSNILLWYCVHQSANLGQKSIQCNNVSIQQLWSQCNVTPTLWPITKMVDVSQQPTYGLERQIQSPASIAFISPESIFN